MTNRRTLPVSFPRRKKAFTLAEIVIALAVTSFCIIVLVALLPVGINSALGSRRDTRAAYLAEQIVSDLRSSSFTNAMILGGGGGGTNSTLAPLNPSFGLNTNGTYVVTCDGSNDVLSTVTPSQYASPVTTAGADYLVQITVVPAALTNLSYVYVEVSTPAQAALTARSRYDFETMIGNRQ